MRWQTCLGLGCVSLFAMFVAAPGCGSSDGTTSEGAGGGDTQANGTGSAQGGDNGTGGSFFVTSSGGSSGQGGDDNCAEVTQEATLTSRPVDIIFVIDNSGSMGAEIDEVEEQINANFATIINSAMPAIDYRVLMVTAHDGSSNNTSQPICVSAPLSGAPDADMDGHCDGNVAQPVESMNFRHHSYPIGSHNALCQLLESYTDADQYNLHPNGWQTEIRQEAFKFFVVITDDGVVCNFDGNQFDDNDNVNDGQSTAAAWDSAVLALDPNQFGTEMERNYQFWSIISQAPYMTSGMKPDGIPVPPTEPSTSAECTPSAVAPGTAYQSLSILTEGYRFPTCGLDYTDIFTLMAQGVIDGAQVSCEFEIPDPPDGEQLDLETVEVIYSSDGMEVDRYTQVADDTACTPTSFYIADETITLCPGACTTVQADEDAKIDLSFDCLQIVE